MGFKSRFQVFAKRETQSGVLAPSLINIVNAKIEPIDPSFTFDVAKYERQIVRGTFTPAAGLAGIVEAKMSFGVEVGGTSVTTVGAVPPWMPLLEACSWQSAAIKAFGIAATFAGTSGRKVFEHGETVTGGTSAATGTVMHDTWEGQAIMRVRVLTGTFQAAETLTSTISGATTTVATSAGGATPSGTPVDAGTTYWPTTFNAIELAIDAINGTPAVNNLYKGASSGAILVAQSGTVVSAGPGTAIDQPFLVLDGTVTQGETLTNRTQIGVADVDVANIADFVEQITVPTYSLALIEDGRIKVMKGARGTVSFSAQIGQPIIAQFEFTGILSSISDGVRLPGVAYEQITPPKFLGAEVKVGTVANLSYGAEHTPRITSITLDTGAQVATQKDATQANGAFVANVTGRQPSGSIDPELRPEASFPFLDLLEGGDPFRLRLRVGSVTRNAFLFTAPSATPESESPGERDGIATNEYPFGLSGQKFNGTNGEDNELVLTFAVAHTTF
ncbi:MAG: hypothetical protein M3N56_16625 [Actinomycetota bacterium]|nr:hypothetical protein [Actinomycetota bacterium]